MCRGVSTRKVAAITEELCGHEFSAITAKLDAQLEEFSRRKLEPEFPYVVVDARYERVREGGVIVSRAISIALGIDWEGRRQVLAVEYANRESQSSWREFLLQLKERGLQDVQFVVSDDHPGLKAAIRPAGWTSDDHFTAAGTLIEAWASLKSFVRKDGADQAKVVAAKDEDPGNPAINFRGEQRRNDTHQPEPCRGRLARPFAARAGAVLLAEGGFGIRREPLLAADTDFAEMLFLHPAFSTAPFFDRYASFGPMANHFTASAGRTSSR